MEHTFYFTDSSMEFDISVSSLSSKQISLSYSSGNKDFTVFASIDTISYECTCIIRNLGLDTGGVCVAFYYEKDTVKSLIEIIPVQGLKLKFDTWFWITLYTI